MIRTVRTRYSGGKLEPLEPLALEEGRELEVSFEDEPAANGASEPERTATAEDAPPKRGLAGIIEKVKEAHAAMPPDAWDDLPTDLAQNFRRYRYGWLKEEDRWPEERS